MALHIRHALYLPSRWEGREGGGRGPTRDQGGDHLHECLVMWRGLEEEGGVCRKPHQHVVHSLTQPTNQSSRFMGHGKGYPKI